MLTSYSVLLQAQHLDYDETGDDDPQLIKLIHDLSRTARILWPADSPISMPRSVKVWITAPIADDVLPV